MAQVLVVDDDQAIRETLKEILQYESYEVLEASDGQATLQQLKKGAPDVMLLDIKMPRMDGMEVLEKAREMHPRLPIIMITGHGTIETAVDAVKKGAFDFLSKPPDLNRLLITVRNATEKGRLIEETQELRRKVDRAVQGRMLGNSPAIQKIKHQIDKVAPTDARVLVAGPNGSGKELVARAIHQQSQRSEGPFVEVNCAAIPSELIESELFGHEKGAFTSAVKKRTGKFEQAEGGTLFLDEIGDMSFSAQAKVLRVLQEKKITRVGGEKDIDVDVRVLAATNKDLSQAIAEGDFREDLYHRLSVIIISVPPLRERTEDIPELADFFLQEICEQYDMPKKEWAEGALEALQKLPWTGNIRELRNVVERLVILCGKSITSQDVEELAQPLGHQPTKIHPAHFSDLQSFQQEALRWFVQTKAQEMNYNLPAVAAVSGLEESYIESLLR
jgi:DNA-binding NtrC family response regulator